MDTVELNTSLKDRLGDNVEYVGIYCSDELDGIVNPSEMREKPIVFIANTLQTTDENILGHWLCFYISLKENVAIYFDSFGLDPRMYGKGFRRLINNSPFEWFGFKEQLQPVNSVKCGLYVLMFIHHISFSNLRETVCFVHRLFSERHRIRNDKLVTQYFFKHINQTGCESWKGLINKAISYKECLSLIKRNPVE